MIPKIIHYIWLSNDEKPDFIKTCMNTWQKKMPEYTIKCWNMENSPKIPWVQEAIKAKKWAFASDYIRLYALYNEGGIYLDSDVLVKKSFNDFENYSYYTSLEYNRKMFYSTKSNLLINKDGTKKAPENIIRGLTIQAAIVGSEKGNPLLKEAMKFYEENHFLLPDGSCDYSHVAPDVIAFVLEKYGFKYINKNQFLPNNIAIFSTKTFASGIQNTSSENYAIHVYTSNWRDYTFIQKIVRKIKLYIKEYLINKHAK